MTDVYLWGFIAACVAGLIGVILNPARIYEFPWAINAVFAGFVGMQVYSLHNMPEILPPGALERTLLMTNLCLACCWLGYWLVPTNPAHSFMSIRILPRRLLHGGVLLLAIGWIFGALVWDPYAGERNAQGQMSGAETIYHFFAALRYIGFAVCLHVALRKPSVEAILASVAGVVAPVIYAVAYGRREPAVLAVLTIGLNLYFERGIRPPRLLVAGLIAVATVMIPVTGKYRDVVLEQGVLEVQQLDPLDLFWQSLDRGYAPEMYIAAHAIHATDVTGRMGFGADYWNTMVFRFVPAQLLGKEFKESLMFNTARAGVLDASIYHSGYTGYGATCTGIADAYQEFGLAGCLVFVLIARFFRWLWIYAARGGSAARLLYTAMLTQGMIALTHQTSNFLPGLMYNILFLGPVLWYASRRGKR
jgi:hypothetical protein